MTTDTQQTSTKTKPKKIGQTVIAKYLHENGYEAIPPHIFYAARSSHMSCVSLLREHIVGYNISDNEPQKGFQSLLIGQYVMLNNGLNS